MFQGLDRDLLTDDLCLQMRANSRPRAHTPSSSLAAAWYCFHINRFGDLSLPGARIQSIAELILSATLVRAILSYPVRLSLKNHTFARLATNSVGDITIFCL
jgi:hypothetical protein